MLWGSRLFMEEPIGMSDSMSPLTRDDVLCGQCY